ncbi:MAG: hypothetical protein K6V97_11205 [Actinomycetia bacterium]|nr:hypothetical protein [Actinomycetes bacterium]
MPIPRRARRWAGLATAAALAASALAGCGTAAAAPGLPLSPDPAVMPVYAPNGREMVLDAAVYPVVVASLQAPAALRQVTAGYDRIPAPKRPLMLVLVGAGSPRPAAAIRQAQQVLSRNHISLPWALQIGPATLYTPTTPALVTATPSGATHRTTGLAAVLGALPRAVALPAPTSKAARPGGTAR